MSVTRALSAQLLLALVCTSEPAAAVQIPGVSGLCSDRPVVVGATATDPTQPFLSGSTSAREASDLFCLELFSTAAGGDAVGVVELGRVPGPFGVTLSPEGYHIYELTAWIDGLPEPADLGPFATYVAWATTPVFDTVVKLGAVGNGRNELGPVGLNKFLVLISAEESALVEERSGRLVLRGRSPSSLMESHDLLAQAPSALQPPPAGGNPGLGVATWRMPPMYPGVPVLPGVAGLRPRTGSLALDPDSSGPIPDAVPRTVVDLPNGGTLDLEAAFVRKEINGRVLTMMAFNGQQPGPLIRVQESSTIFVNFTNSTPFPTSIHWHGVRLDNRFDGVPGVTQEPVAPGGSFRYQIFFRDAGIYWYHPHHREDVQQESGLYGNMLVDPLEAEYYSPVNREEVLILDDVLLGDEGLVPFGRESANYMLMGRFGNVLLVNGEPDYRLEVGRGAVVRFFLTNASNTRTFNVSLARAEPGAERGRDVAVPLEMKVVASDVGKFEREEMTRSAPIAPAERYVLEVRFDEPGDYLLRNVVQGISHRQGAYLPETTTLGIVSVSEEAPDADHSHSFATLRENVEVIADIDRYRAWFDRTPDHELLLTLELVNLPLPLEQSMLYDWVYFNPVEWTGTMPVMNWSSTGAEVRWILREAETGRDNLDIEWRFRVGDVVKIRIHNDRDAFHAMQHPLHIHGQRFLVLEQNGVANENLVWKDTVLLPAGSTTDILLELSNPGRWMVHCHIAEHLESGMKFVMNVEG